MPVRGHGWIALFLALSASTQADTDLQQALKDCNRAYDLMGISFWSSKPKWSPPWTASLLATRGLVELRQGESGPAIADNQAAIKLEPHEPFALYTRGLAELRESSQRQGQSDLAAARKLQPDIGKWYAGIGLTP